MMNSEEQSTSYYGVLGVGSDSSASEIRRAYRKLAMQWHPDRWTRNGSLLGEVKTKFQKIQEAYSVLSDKRKRTMYDAGFYDPNQEDEGGGDNDHDEGFCNFMQEMLSLMAAVKRKENKVYSMEELQQMFMEMAQGFNAFGTTESSSSLCSSRNGNIMEDCCRNISKRPRWESNPYIVRDSRLSSV